MMKKLIFIICFILLFPAIGLTTNYYVNCEGSGSDAGTFANPWLDLTNVDNQVLADGSDIYFKEGTTCTIANSINIDFEGVNANNRSVIGCYDAENSFDCSGTRPIITQTGVDSFNFDVDGPSNIGAEYLRFEYLDIRNSQTATYEDSNSTGIFTDSIEGNYDKGGWVINNCHFSYFGHYALHLHQMGDNNIVTNNTFTNVGNAIYFIDETGNEDGSNYNYIAGNVCSNIVGYDNGGGKIDGHCVGLQRPTYTIVEDNTSTSAYSGTFGYFTNVAYTGPVAHNITRRNMSYGSAQHAMVMSGHQYSGHNLVYQNIFTDSSSVSSRGFVRILNTDVSSGGGTKLFNNTVYNTYQYGFSIHAQYDSLDYIYAKNNIILLDASANANDIFWQMETTGAFTLGTNFFIDNNLYWTVDDSDPTAESRWQDRNKTLYPWGTWRSTAGRDTNSPATLADPSFVDPATNDFTLSSTSSPAYDAGGYLAYVTVCSGTTITVNDTYWFHGDFGLVDEDGASITGMEITFYDETYGLQNRTITTNEITHGTPGSFVIDSALSACITGGTLGNPTTTTQVALRFIGIAPDIGAHEYDAATPPGDPATNPFLGILPQGCIFN